MEQAVLPSLPEKTLGCCCRRFRRTTTPQHTPQQPHNNHPTPAAPADAALVAVVGLLVQVIVKEAALEARVGAKLHPAGRAADGDGLARVAQRAHQLGDGLAVQLVLALPV
jgi:hypothetical protein